MTKPLAEDNNLRAISKVLDNNMDGWKDAKTYLNPISLYSTSNVYDEYEITKRTCLWGVMENILHEHKIKVSTTTTPSLCCSLAENTQVQDT